MRPRRRGLDPRRDDDELDRSDYLDSIDDHPPMFDESEERRDPAMDVDTYVLDHQGTFERHHCATAE